MSDDYRRGIEDAAKRVEGFTTANLRRVDVIAAIRGLVGPDETHEQRWRRFGWRVEWSDRERAYRVATMNGLYLAYCKTITDVDEWIDEH
jgi:hypothetical protein